MGIKDQPTKTDRRAICGKCRQTFRRDELQSINAKCYPGEEGKVTCEVVRLRFCRTCFDATLAVCRSQEWVQARDEFEITEEFTGDDGQDGQGKDSGSAGQVVPACHVNGACRPSDSRASRAGAGAGRGRDSQRGRLG